LQSFLYIQPAEQDNHYLFFGTLILAPVSSAYFVVYSSVVADFSEADVFVIMHRNARRCLAGGRGGNCLCWYNSWLVHGNGICFMGWVSELEICPTRTV